MLLEARLVQRRPQLYPTCCCECSTGPRHYFTQAFRIRIFTCVASLHIATYAVLIHAVFVLKTMPMKLSLPPSPTAYTSAFLTSICIYIYIYLYHRLAIYTINFQGLIQHFLKHHGREYSDLLLQLLDQNP